MTWETSITSIMAVQNHGIPWLFSASIDWFKGKITGKSHMTHGRIWRVFGESIFPSTHPFINSSIFSAGSREHLPAVRSPESHPLGDAEWSLPSQRVRSSESGAERRFRGFMTIIDGDIYILICLHIFNIYIYITFYMYK